MSRSGPTGSSCRATSTTPLKPFRRSAVSTVVPRQFLVVAALAQVGQEHRAEPRMQRLHQQVGRRAIGQVTRRSGDPLLHRRRIAARTEQDLVVIGLEDHRGEFAQQQAHRRSGAAEIVRDADLHPVE